MSSYTMGYRQVRGPEKRKDKRLLLPVFTVDLNGTTCSTVNWSLGGLLISDFVGELKEDSIITAEIKAKDSQADVHLRLPARVIRHDSQTGEVALKFEQMDPQIYDFFEQCLSRQFKRHS
ncbi:PilZ domain-containing protein [Dongia soli]|uniref:PilZ domain-containing protein n=1 Tax=Dongia soli TaxID=600628 RepID=A0ABU5E5W0_9PROT|nr:PilZ domain-containing protein [Dongia soli]MDY0881702.1 PilZ domain-containing protein [Dongia soli]